MARVQPVATPLSVAEPAALPPAPVEDVPGAAPTMGGELPEDVTPLTARFTPRRLDVPRVRPGRAAGFTFDGSKRGWVVRLPESSRQHLLTPSYGGGHVYVGGGFESHQLYAIDASSGRIDWMAAAPDGGPTAAILDDDKVLFNTESCTLFALDAATGTPRWSRWLGDPLMSQPASTNGRVFSGHVRDGGGYGFTAMDLDDGHVLWTRWISADVMNAPVLDGESVYFTTMDGVVWRFDQATGRRVWRQRLGATSAPWLLGDALHVARRTSVEREGATTRGEQSVVLSVADGSLLHAFDGVPGRFVGGRPDAAGTPAGWAYEGSRPTIVDGRLYQTIGDEVQSRDATTGELLWRRRYTHEVGHRPASPPAVAGGQLVFGTREGVLYGLDIDTGMTTFAYDVGAPIAAQPTVASGWVYAATTRGNVVGLEIADASMGGWHMWGGDARHNGPTAEPVVELAATADEGGPTEGTMRLRDAPADGELEGFPLTATNVHARVSEFVARVTVEQTFENPYERAIEAVYLFPLPDDAAVDAMELRVGERTIRGQIRERVEAVREYRAARERGALASLLEQERPNLFRQSVANVPPGQSIRVVLSYTQALPYEEGSYRFGFPMVAGPQYAPTAGEANEDGSTPIAVGGAREDRVTVSIDAALGGSLREVSSPTHSVEVERRGERAAHVSLVETAPDHDLEVRFAVAGDEPSVSVLANARADRDTGYLSLLVHPRLAVPTAEVTPRELVVVLDTSSSMRGRPFELAKAAALRAIAGLRPTDTFRVVRFSDRASELSPTPLPATPENVERARALVSSMTALGSTEMRRGVSAALAPPIEDGRLRVVVLMTDGYVGNEAEVLREVNAALGHSRVFAFGVGAVVNRYLLSRLAEIGRGDLSVVTPTESPEAAADAFVERLETPYLTDVRVDWGALAVSNVYPRRVPDLYADRPLVVHGRYAHGGRGEITIRGRIAGQPFEQKVDVELPETGAERPELESLWARARIRDLMTEMALRPTDALREEVTRVGLEHSLMTQWTAFIAIDDGAALPNGVDYGGQARRVGPGGSVGGLGLVGYGRGGGGTGYGTIGIGSFGTIGHGAGVAARQIRIPQIRTGTAEVRGSLSREVIQRVVRRQLPAVRYCYEQRLATAPNLQGRLTVAFIVAPDGSVSAANVAQSTLTDETTEACVLAVIRRMQFPMAEGGGPVGVNYPFVFQIPDDPPYAPELPRPLPDL
ncbi:MAG: TonB family protein [Sandaracinaceae bacterium]|nr:TonB family protein [Sandaracinaceae bacterium]